MKKLIYLLIVFLTFSACDMGQPNHFEELLIDYKSGYDQEWLTSHLENIDEKSKTRINKLESVEDVTTEFLYVLEEWKFIYSGQLNFTEIGTRVYKKDSNSKNQLTRLALNTHILANHWENLMEHCRRRYKNCDSWWEKNNINNFKELLYNQGAFKRKAEGTLSQLARSMINSGLEWDDIDCNGGLSDIDKENFRDRLDKDSWVVPTNF